MYNRKVVNSIKFKQSSKNFLNLVYHNKNGLLSLTLSKCIYAITTSFTTGVMHPHQKANIASVTAVNQKRIIKAPLLKTFNMFNREKHNLRILRD